MRVFVTGHRPKDLPGGYSHVSPQNLELKKVLQEILSEIKSHNSGPLEVISGMALGVDMMYFEVGVTLRNSSPVDYILHSVLPHLDQSNKWTESSRVEWEYLRGLSDQETIVVEGEPFSSSHLLVRNAVMANMSDLCISVWDGSSGGTSNATEYAMELGMNIIHVHPRTLKVSIMTRVLFENLVKYSK